MTQYKNAQDAAQVDGGTVTGYASTFDREPDSYGDVIAKGAFARSVEAWREKMGQGIYLPLLYGHKVDDPAYNIGRVTDLREDERGLLVTAEFDAENEKAQYVRKLVKEGRLYQFSFAFDCTDFGEVTLEDGTKAQELRECTVYEVSLVQIPANQHAEVVEVKSAKSGRRNSKADELRLAEVLDKLADIIGDATEAQSIVNGLMAEKQQETEPGEDANAEEETNADEPKRSEAEVKALLDEASKYIEMKG